MKSFHTSIHIRLQEDCEHVVIEARKAAQFAGFGNTDQVLISTAASELSTNILRYAGYGNIELSVVRDHYRICVEILAVDNGPGIVDISLALQDHYTTTRGSLGLGLSSVKRIMDDFEINSQPGVGTKILARKWKHYV